MQNSVRTTIADDNNNSLIQQQNDISYSTSLFSSASISYFFKDKSFIDLKYIHQIKEQDKDVDTHTENFRSDILKSVSDIKRLGVNNNTFDQIMFRFRNNLQKDGRMPFALLGIKIEALIGIDSRLSNCLDTSSILPRGFHTLNSSPWERL